MHSPTQKGTQELSPFGTARLTVLGTGKKHNGRNKGRKIQCHENIFKRSLSAWLLRDTWSHVPVRQSVVRLESSDTSWFTKCLWHRLPLSLEKSHWRWNRSNVPHLRPLRLCLSHNDPLCCILISAHIFTNMSISRATQRRAVALQFPL